MGGGGDSLVTERRGAEKGSSRRNLVMSASFCFILAFGLYTWLIAVVVKNLVVTGDKSRASAYPVLAEKLYHVDVQRIGTWYTIVFAKELPGGKAVALSLWHDRQQHWLLLTVPRLHRDFEDIAASSPGTEVKVSRAYGVDFAGDVDNPALQMKFYVAAPQTTDGKN